MFLKQSTQAVIMVGPIEDISGVIQSGVAITQSNVLLSKNGGAFAQKNSADTYTHNSSGYYSGVLDATDTNTCGNLKLSINIANCLPYFETYNILAANIYNTWVGTDTQTVSLGLPSISTIVASGNAANWSGVANTSALALQTTLVSVSGAVTTLPSIGTIISSGNAANWSGIADTSALALQATLVSVSGSITNLPSIGTIVTSGNAANWSGVADLTTVNTKLDVISGYTDHLPSIDTIVTSGNVAGWNADTTNVTVTDINAASLGKIVASGNAANWNATATTVTVSGYTPDAINAIYTKVIDGTDTASGILKQVRSYARGDINHSGVSENEIVDIYKDSAGATLWTSTVTNTGRSTT